MTDIQKEHDELCEKLKDLVGQKGNKYQYLIGWSIRDCLDNSNTSQTMKRILELREQLDGQKN